MARVPGKMYRKITQHAFTRREYMGGVPASRIIQYESGNKQADFPVQLDLKVQERGQIRHTALEALRITAVRALDRKIGRENYKLKIRVYPHHVLRQNKQASGAGADRVSMGMRLSYGKPIGTAARVEVGQPVITIYTVARGIEFAKDALRKCYNKVAMPCVIDVSATGDRDLQEMLAIAASRGGRALSGAGGDSEEDAPATEGDAEASDAEGEAEADGEDAEAETAEASEAA